jgi:hypothetical protein
MVTLRLHTLVLLVLLVLLALLFPAVGQSTSVSIHGLVRAEDGHSIPGATVIVQDTGIVVAGVATDKTGCFDLRLSQNPSGPVELRVSSVGYKTQTQRIPIDRLHDAVTVSLTEVTVEVPGMTVTPTYFGLPQQIIRQDAVVARAAQSLVMTNPIAAIKQPQVSRVGSNLSSQIRVYGTNPVYSLNGLPIGTDPAHYGMFSYVPASIVDKMEFEPLGTPADQQLPSVVEFGTAELFGQGSNADLTLSTIEATGTFSLATDRLYTQGSLRKSVLDRLVNQLDISTDRATLPPTNFQDVFGTFGIKLSRTTRLMIDHYQVRDFLSYNSSNVADVTSIDTYQATREQQFGVRLEDRRSNLITHAALSSRRGTRDYKATPNNDAPTETIRVNLNEDYRTDFGQVGADLNWSHLLLKAGLETEKDRYRDYFLSQHNWNFLPPFANTDNPFIYQQALNDTYGECAGDARQSRTSSFFSGEMPVGAASLTLGIRQDNYTPLADGKQLSYRTRLGWALGSRTNVSLSWGTYSNSPLDNVLESYQVMIRTNLDRLSPVLTELGSLQIGYGGFNAGVFTKTLDNLPVVSPDFNDITASTGTIDRDFIAITSEGTARFDGFFATLEQAHLLGDRLGLTLSYAYTVSRYCDHGVITRYDLDVPHRFQMQIDYRCTKKLNLGAELQIRSGYPYSPLRTNWSRNESDLYRWEYYRAALEDDNSLRFTTNAYLNLSSSYRMNRVELLLSVSNVTNRSNPVVNSSAGLIYDAGILPMLGVRMTF